jgi:hypothetical protein
LQGLFAALGEPLISLAHSSAGEPSILVPEFAKGSRSLDNLNVTYETHLRKITPLYTRDIAVTKVRYWSGYFRPGIPLPPQKPKSRRSFGQNGLKNPHSRRGFCDFRPLKNPNFCRCLRGASQVLLQFSQGIHQLCFLINNDSSHSSRRLWFTGEQGCQSPPLWKYFHIVLELDDKQKSIF